MNEYLKQYMKFRSKFRKEASTYVNLERNPKQTGK